MPKIAAIDVGSNAIRLLIITFNRYGIKTDEQFTRYPLRLGADVFAQKTIGTATKAKLLNVFQNISQKLTKAKVINYRAVATSAMRDAKNGAALIKTILKETNIRCEIISGREESILSKQALLQAVGHVPASTLLVDLGGGSLELQNADQPRGKSIPFGTLRIAQAYPGLGKTLNSSELTRERVQLKTALKKHIKKAKKSPLGIGTGGNLDVLAKLVPLNKSLMPTIKVKSLANFSEKLSRYTIKERQHLYSLRSDRADIILPASLVIQCLSEIYNLEKILVPGTGLREALCEELSQKQANQDFESVLFTGQISKETRASLAGLEQLFLQLKPVLQLWGPALRLAKITALCLLTTPYKKAKDSTLSEVAIQNATELKLTKAELRDTIYIIKQATHRKVAKSVGPAREKDRKACDKVAALCALHFWCVRSGISKPPNISFENQGVEVLLARRKPIPDKLKVQLRKALKRKIAFSYERSSISDVT